MADHLNTVYHKDTALKLLNEIEDGNNTNLGTRELLDRFRELDRQDENFSKFKNTCHSER